VKIGDILSCFDIDETPPKIEQSLLHATLANLLVATELGHLPVDVGRSFVADALAKWDETLAPSAGTAPGAHIDLSRHTIVTVWTALYSLLSREDPTKYFKHTLPLAKSGSTEEVSEFPDVPLVSVQDVKMFKFWLRDMEPIAAEQHLKEYSRADVMSFIKACKDADRRRPNSVVGRPKAILWLTPLSGMIATLVERAATAMASDVEHLEALDIGAMARNRLGLWKKRSPDHAVALVTRKSYAAYLDELGQRMKAPTVLDAEGYDRFRHWPTPRNNPADMLGRGRTYELDPVVRNMERPLDGAPEIVAPPLPFEEIESIVYLGPFGHPPGCNPEDERLCYLEFANEVAGGAPLTAVVAEIEQTFAV
jgi:hypothetical protein